MSAAVLFALAGVGLFASGLHAVIVRAHLLWQILALNVMASGVFLLIVALAQPADPVPQALVITGIVVAVAATGLALALMLRLHAATGRQELPTGDRD